MILANLMIQIISEVTCQPYTLPVIDDNSPEVLQRSQLQCCEHINTKDDGRNVTSTTYVLCQLGQFTFAEKLVLVHLSY